MSSGKMNEIVPERVLWYRANLSAIPLRIALNPAMARYPNDFDSHELIWTIASCREKDYFCGFMVDCKSAEVTERLSESSISSPKIDKYYRAFQEAKASAMNTEFM